MSSRRMHIKRIVIAAMAIALMLGLAGGVGHAAKSNKVKSQVEIDGENFGNEPPFEFRFAGDVHSKKPKCERRRSISIYETTIGERVLRGTAKTDRTGDWELIYPEGNEPGTTWEAKVETKKFEHGKDLTCKKDVSPPFTIPPL